MASQKRGQPITSAQKYGLSLCAVRISSTECGLVRGSRQHLYQGVSVLRGKDPEIDPQKNWILRMLNRYLPVSRNLDGHNFFTVENGKRLVDLPP